MSRNKKIDSINQRLAEEARQHNIKEGLSEIYQDDSGVIIDVKKLDIKSGKGWRWWLLSGTVYVVVAVGLAWLAIYFLGRGTDATAVDLTIDSDKNLTAGQEFTYTVTYRNLEKVALRQARLHLEYPAAFVLGAAEPAPTEGDNVWQLETVNPDGGGTIKIKGRLINEIGKSNVILGELTYEPANFSSEFKKVASLDRVIESSGLEMAAMANASALPGEERQIIFKYKLKDNGVINRFRLTVEPSTIADLEFIKDESTDKRLTLLKPWVWQVEDVGTEERSIKIAFRFIDQTKDQYSFLLRAEYPETVAAPLAAEAPVASSSPATAAPEKLFLFYQETVAMALVKNDLNLILVINGSDKEQSVNFGQNLQYTISYENRSSRAMEEVVLMAVAEGDLVDWSSLNDKNKGQRKNNTLTWTKNEIPSLAVLSPGDKGEINFSLRVKDAALLNLKKGVEMRSYAQFTTDQLTGEAGGTAEQTAAAKNKSNEVISRINSDLNLAQHLRYFNEDNVPVGSGPLPFSVGQKTVVRAGWQISNTLHDLKEVVVSVKLPDYVSWEGKNQASVGQISYDPSSRLISWRIDNLPVGVNQAGVEFNVGVEPTAAERRQILIILPKATISAIDLSTGDQLSSSSQARTTKLEDDNIIKEVDIDLNGGLVK